jgi:hypothetical protein
MIKTKVVSEVFVFYPMLVTNKLIKVLIYFLAKETSNLLYELKCKQLHSHPFSQTSSARYVTMLAIHAMLLNMTHHSNVDISPICLPSGLHSR